MPLGAPQRLVLAACVVDLVAAVVRRDDTVVPLTPTERDLLAYLAQRPGEVVDRDTLLREVWGYERPPLTRAVDQAIGHVRTKIEADPRHPAHLHSVYGEGYRFTPAAAALEARHNLRPPDTPFVGRGAELAALGALLAEGAPIVTVLGPPGAGKTRLVTELGATVVDEWPGGVWLCDLSSAQPSQVAEVLARTLPLPDPVDDLPSVLAGLDPTLVLLDGFDRVLSAAPAVAGWAVAAPGVRFVITSRERLLIQGEHVLRLGPLEAAPDEESWALLDDDARRALALCSVFRGSFTIESAEAVLGTDALDRLQSLQDHSLLAAGGSRLALYLGVRQLAAHKLDELGLRTLAEERHKDWFLARGEALAAAFTAHGDQETAEALGIEADDLVAVLDRFGDREPIDAVRACLVVAPVLPPAEALSHLDRALGLAPPDTDWHARVLAAQGTARRASGHLADGLRDLEAAADIAHDTQSVVLGELADALIEAGRYGDARERASRALDRAGDRIARALHHRRLAIACDRLGDPAAASAHAAAALEVFRGREGSPSRLAELHAIAGTIAHHTGDLEEARTHHEQALALARSLGPRSVAAHLGDLGNVHADRGDLERAEACHQEALAIERQLGLRHAEARTRVDLGLVALAAGETAKAVIRAEQALAQARSAGDPLPEALMVLGIAALVEGEPMEALSRLRQARALADDVLIGAWLGAAEVRTGSVEPGRDHLAAARASGRHDAVALCEALEGHAALGSIHARIAVSMQH